MAASYHHIAIDVDTALAEQSHLGHNRWHEDIPPIVEVESGDTLSIETLDTLDGQLTEDSTSADLANIDLSLAHPLTGPVAVKGAKPGDLLEVKLLGVEADPWTNWGFTAIVPGFGLLQDLFLEPYLVHWDLLDDYYAESAEIPGVRIPYGAYPGIVGVAPSTQLRESIMERENDIIERGGTCLPPSSPGAVPRGVIAEEGLRTITPREIGGNIDIKQLTAGSSLFLPVHADGGLLSVGDAHYAQGDGESCGTAIEMRSVLHLRIKLHSGGAERRNVRSPQFSHGGNFNGTDMAIPRRFYATTGLPIHPDGRNEAENLALAARNAVLSMIDHLETRGYDRRQAYALCSVAVDLKVTQAVNAPNFMVSAVLPLDIFV